MQNLRKLCIYAATLWFGMQIMAGYIAAPVLFKILPKMQAGEIAGILFGIISWSGLAVWGASYLTHAAILKRKQKLALSLLLLTIAANQFLVTPVINALKYQQSNWLLSLTGGSFGAWHGISSIIFMATAILAAGLSWNLSGKSAYTRD